MRITPFCNTEFLYSSLFSRAVYHKHAVPGGKQPQSYQYGCLWEYPHNRMELQRHAEGGMSGLSSTTFVIPDLRKEGKAPLVSVFWQLTEMLGVFPASYIIQQGLLTVPAGKWKVFKTHTVFLVGCLWKWPGILSSAGNLISSWFHGQGWLRFHILNRYSSRSEDNKQILENVIASKPLKSTKLRLCFVQGSELCSKTSGSRRKPWLV